ncbi:hypothetical protein H2199_008062 [Coniosporium tulheliwenetii]|uniref:Uncharacterized protein n=1 Tax=Coniosporium tulheliwenetii TaxID=3383036 RepID=A0ACC2YMA3_9PEZI|nr:hypothetical protein H2199_008062 [Cladosporium sp. JES 115]
MTISDSPDCEKDQRNTTTNLKHRRMASTGGNRSWSEEEETYLLQTRMQKMPYKHIAAQLKKTELACRLVTPRTSPEPNLHHLSGLRINTAEHILQRPSTVTSIDTDRLRAIYEARRAAFWASIAAEYGQDVSPIHLEQVWRQTCNVARPLTPPEDGNSHFKARPLPPLYAQPAASASERLQGRLFDTTPTTAGVSAVSAPERLQYTLPTLTPSTTGTGTPSMSLSRASTWSETSSVPATAIAALLTVDKEPRPDVDADTIMHG